MNRVAINRGMKRTVSIELIVNIIQKELCIDCPVFEYSNKNCKNCSKNIKESYDETFYISRC